MPTYLNVIDCFVADTMVVKSNVLVVDEDFIFIVMHSNCNLEGASREKWL